MARILFIDDDAGFSPLLAEALGEYGHEAHWLDCAEEGLRLLREAPRRWEVVLLDQYMPRMAGLELLAALRPEARPPVLLFTGLDAADVAIRASKLGAFDYLPKPAGLEPSHLAPLLDKIGEAALAARPREAPARLAATEDVLIGKSARMREVHRQVGLAASHDEPALIVGEMGTGKKRAAEAVHRYSARSAGPLVVVNCLAFADEAALNARLFGHGPNQPGAFEQAGGGALLLDHFHLLPLSAQARAAEAIRERAVYRDGPGAVSRPVRARVMGCSSENLRAALAEGRLYWGLYSLLEGAVVSLPALREREDDVLLLADHFLQQAAALAHRPAPALSSRARRLLLAHAWPGNVRELQGAMRQAALSCGGEVGPEALAIEAEAPRGLPPSREKAYRLFRWAVGREPALSGATDAEVFRWLQRDGRVEGDDLPGSCATFCRYLREARSFYNSQKNSPRAGRPLGRSIVRAGEA